MLCAGCNSSCMCRSRRQRLDNFPYRYWNAVVEEVVVVGVLRVQSTSTPELRELR